MFVRMRSAFSFDQENGTRRTIPAGWAGDLDDAIAQSAVDGGYTSEPASKAPASRTGQVVAEPTAASAAAKISATTTGPSGGAQTRDGAADDGAANDSMTRSELEQVARSRGIDPDDHRTKADLIAAINARR